MVPRGCEVLFHVCHVAEAQTHPARLVSAPGFQPEGAEEHARVNLGAEEHARVNLVAMDNVVHAARKAGCDGSSTAPVGARTGGSPRGRK